jgi:hypothetical protein
MQNMKVDTGICRMYGFIISLFNQKISTYTIRQSLKVCMGTIGLFELRASGLNLCLCEKNTH